MYIMPRYNRTLPHDEKDIGFRTCIQGGLQHYYRSHFRSGVAMSHCGLIAPKSNLVISYAALHCSYCSTIEDMRDELDGKNDHANK